MDNGMDNTYMMNQLLANNEGQAKMNTTEYLTSLFRRAGPLS